PGQTVDLIDDNDIDAPRFDISQQPLERWPFHVAAGMSAIIIAIWSERPALVALRPNIGFASLALGIKAIEALVQPLLSGFARIDCAADHLHSLGALGSPSHRHPCRSGRRSAGRTRRCR